MNFSFDYFIGLIPKLINGVNATMSMSLLSFIFALIIGICLALISVYRTKILYPISKIYVSFFRGTPLLAQMYFLYFGMPIVFPVLKYINSYTAAVIGLSLNMSAYMSETIRATIESVDKGQIEAGLSIGMTEFQVMQRIVFVQAARIAIPPLSNNFIDLIKGSSIAFTIGATEIMAEAKMAGALSYRYFEAYGAAMLIYWIVIAILGVFQRKLEKYMNLAY